MGTYLGMQPTFYPKSAGSTFTGVKQPEHVTDHKSPTSAKGMKYTVLSSAHDCMPWHLLKHRKNLNLTLF